MSKEYFYFKSRPGVIWVLVKKKGQWIRTLIFPQTIEPDVDTLRFMNRLNDNSWCMHKMGELDDE